MNPGTLYSAASLLNPRAKQSKKQLSNGRPKPSLASTPAAIPSAHALLNPKGSSINKTKQHDSSGNSTTAESGGGGDHDLTNDNTNPRRSEDPGAGRTIPLHAPVSSTATTLSNPQYVFAKTNGTTEDAEDHDTYNDQIGQAALIARTHNIHDRSEQHAKRQKLSTANGSSWVGSKGSSAVAQHLKEKRAEGLAERNSTKSSDARAEPIIDLTHDEQEETVQMDDDDESRAEETVFQDSKSEESDIEDPEVCIGQIDGAMISIDHIPAVPSTSKVLNPHMWPAHRIVLKKLNQRDLRITAFDCNGQDFGTLGHTWAYAISQALNGNKITKLTAILLNRKRRPGQSPGDSVSDKIPAHVLVFCKKSIGLNLYKQLAKAKTPLRTPVASDETLERINYYNVEVELYEDGGADALAGARIDPAALQKLEHDVFNVLNDIPEHGDLIRMEPDPEYITTPLLDYQKQGLQFMTEQEVENIELLYENEEATFSSGAAGRSLWRLRIDDKNSPKFLNRATGHVQNDPPFHTMGGLLADEMGLGKTLTVIALIASTIEAAEDWCQSVKGGNVDGINLCNVRTTLVIAPTTVLQNWEEQFANHTAKESLSVLKYHGVSRPTVLDDLTSYDVILTTYGTVQSEMSWRTARDKRRKSLFAHFNFYRIVLDEAHYIKGHTTDRAKSIFNLHAERRWAITGTPIQNGLEDFGSVLKFLRLAPFDKIFKQLVTLPAKREPEIVLGRMRVVFNSITLRRTKEKLTLPQNSKTVQRIRFRDDERQLYDRFTKEIDRKIHDIANDELSRNYMTFFSQLLSCRRICDSTDLLSDKELGFLGDSTAAKDPDNEQGSSFGHDLTEDEGYKQLEALNEFMAAECSRCSNVLLKDPLDGESDVQEICRFWDCHCFICPDCTEEFEKAVESCEEDGKFKCPETDIIARVKSVKLTYKRFMRYRERLLQKEQEGSGKVARRYTKASSKTQALLQHLEEARRVGYTEGLPNKAVVFTYWANYLDLLQIDLTKAGFKFLRLDGSVVQSKRVRILESFNTDPDITILISTIGVGGVGLNLQVANSVFIMEPQWNPAAEEQAIDRVHRLGQTRKVKTVRFITEDTVEVGVRLLAQQKQALADLTTSRAKLKRSDVTAKVQELLDVLRRR